MWHKLSDGFPEKDGQYLIAHFRIGNTTYRNYEILHFVNDAYKLDKYDFEEYKGKRKKLFAKFDSEYGYCDYTDTVEYWMEIPEIGER